MCYCLARMFFVHGPWSVNTAQRMAFHTSGDLRFASVEFGVFLIERKKERKNESSHKCKIAVVSTSEISSVEILFLPFLL